MIYPFLNIPQSKVRHELLHNRVNDLTIYTQPSSPLKSQMHTCIIDYQPMAQPSPRPSEPAHSTPLATSRVIICCEKGRLFTQVDEESYVLFWGRIRVWGGDRKRGGATHPTPPDHHRLIPVPNFHHIFIHPFVHLGLPEGGVVLVARARLLQHHVAPPAELLHHLFIWGLFYCIAFVFGWCVEVQMKQERARRASISTLRKKDICTP